MNTHTICPHCGKPLSIVRAPVTTGLTQATAGFATSTPQTQPEQKTQGPKLVTCNRCGEENLCWQESKNGKFYLCRIRKDPNGQVIPLRKEFHTCRQ